MIKITFNNLETLEIVINDTNDYCRNTLVEKSLILNQGITKDDFDEIIESGHSFINSFTGEVIEDYNILGEVMS